MPSETILPVCPSFLFFKKLRVTSILGISKISRISMIFYVVKNSCEYTAYLNFLSKQLV